jgi:hypothetical protein
VSYPFTGCVAEPNVSFDIFKCHTVSFLPINEGRHLIKMLNIYRKVLERTGLKTSDVDLFEVSGRAKLRLVHSY